MGARDSSTEARTIAITAIVVASAALMVAIVAVAIAMTPAVEAVGRLLTDAREDAFSEGLVIETEALDDAEDGGRRMRARTVANQAQGIAYYQLALASRMRRACEIGAGGDSVLITAPPTPHDAPLKPGTPVEIEYRCEGRLPGERTLPTGESPWAAMGWDPDAPSWQRVVISVPLRNAPAQNKYSAYRTIIGDRVKSAVRRDCVDGVVTVRGVVPLIEPLLDDDPARYFAAERLHLAMELECTEGQRDTYVTGP
jgi:hypothetical protein